MKKIRLNTIDKFIRIIVFIFFISIAIGSMFTPVYQSLYRYPHGESFYAFYSSFCHQYPTRSLWIMGYPFALCSRCFSAYSGIALASLFLQLHFKYYIRLILGVALIAIVSIDPIIQLYTNYESSNSLRIITGLLGGVAVFLIFYPIKYRG